ncbi:P-loop containing nucleoside triphosphate hydrolase protein [Coniophora puteana RWD-64-598 SS2]|uniref:P-loop containing nucleoside triphosphate hydrolase protein n=1 Tax=Coniophora puteana (strain RWD-64-598) TaxID=741705 RepID=A0A5M3N5L9_CONPW|nr:P-loop containing nucleoside triphosphate hydrolase protein [Coniophora puteana RWD-64-598 SS2]EIW86710.1 P-loop containing nucleoside triphosphate hydrolase protein [Coniophora puteana RWD-64-598 SS2]
MPPSSSSSRGLAARLSAPNTSRNNRRRGSTTGKGQPSHGQGRGTGKGKAKAQPILPQLDGPIYDEACLQQLRSRVEQARSPLKQALVDNPKSPVANFWKESFSGSPVYALEEGIHTETGRRIWRCVLISAFTCFLSHALFRATLAINSDPVVTAHGDHSDKKSAEKLCAMFALYQLHEFGLVRKPKSDPPPTQALAQHVVLSDGTQVDFERCRSFMDYYCRRYDFGKPDIDFEEQRNKRSNSSWHATMTVGGRRIGMGSGSSKKDAQNQCYLDVTQYLESCDATLWKDFIVASKTGRDLGLAPRVHFQMSPPLNDEIRDLCNDIKKSELYRNRPSIGSGLTGSDAPRTVPERPPHQVRASRAPPSQAYLERKSATLSERRKEYLQSPSLARMRETRQTLPIYTRGEDILDHIRANDITICMAATGSGKTTQIPQMILDEYIDQGKGANCNVICTQPRRIAAISVADRVAKERGEVVGSGSIGYSVRFESKVPEDHGSVLFCTTGVLLKKLQSALAEGGEAAARMDQVTHIVVDEVHERDVDTDLLLVVLKQLMADRKARNVPLRVVLMSATIDPRLFQEYFPDQRGKPANVIEIPGRTFPVQKHFLNDFTPALKGKPEAQWVFKDESVVKFLDREKAYELAAGQSQMPVPVDDDSDLPHPLIGLTITHALSSSDSGHVLVFLPGWDDIVAVQRVLQEGRLGINVNDSSQYSLHLLHSTVPLTEQQIIFEPPAPGVRRIILATNIAETSVTIPDVVHVVDVAKVKEVRYDPDKHMSSLVLGWVGSSNLNQRAGRAGRHRPGEYYGLLTVTRASNLHPHQTVEMKRVDLSNVVMHVKALNFPGMEVEEVLAAAIEPPDSTRVAAAMTSLQMVGALDPHKNLTALGRVLLQLPVDVQMGRLVLYGSFFRCLDQALTLAAVLTNRDPFVAPMHLKAEANAAKMKWVPEEFPSDPLAVMNAYNAWWQKQRKGEYVSANRFCTENFLSKPTLLLITKIRGSLLQSLHQAGVIDVSAGGHEGGRYGGSRRGRDELQVPSELNSNGDSLPLLAALIAIASQPKFAVKTGDRTFRTQLEKVALIHPTSVNGRRKLSRPLMEDFGNTEQRQLYAFAEKRRNLSTGGNNPQTFMSTTTRLDPLSYMLFGAYEIKDTDRGVECDGWLPLVGDIYALDDVQRLKTLMESCMLRVFEGIVLGKRSPRELVQRGYGEDEYGDDDEARKATALNGHEIRELDLITRDIVRVLNRYSEERGVSSRASSRPATPPTWASTLSSGRLSNVGWRSGYSTPGVNSRSSTPGLPSWRRF